MIELFIILLTIYVIGVAVFYGIRGLADLFSGDYAKPYPTPKQSDVKSTAHDSEANTKPEEDHISEENFHRLRKRYLQSVKAGYYGRGEGDKWEEMMKVTEDILRKYD